MGMASPPQPHIRFSQAAKRNAAANIGDAAVSDKSVKTAHFQDVIFTKSGYRPHVAVLKDIAFFFLFTEGFALFIENKRIAIFADPAPLPRGVAIHDSKREYGLRYHRAGAHQCVASYFKAANYSGIGANAGAGAYKCLFKFLLPLNKAPGINNVGKHDRRTDEHAILQHHAVVHRNIVLNFHAITNHHVIIHKHILAKDTVGAHNAARHQVREMPHPGAGADLRAGIYNGCWMNKDFRGHGGLKKFWQKNEEYGMAKEKCSIRDANAQCSTETIWAFEKVA